MKSEDLSLYEYRPDELEDVLPFRNAIFGHVSQEHWHAMNCTAIVARQQGNLVGFVPLQYRDQLLTGDLAIPVAYENAVGVAEGMRGRGIGSRMMDAGAGFIQDRVDALFVVRGDERSEGYRFYRKSGHSDLAYARVYERTEDNPGKSDSHGFVSHSRHQWCAREPQLLALYAKHYGSHGGGQQRKQGYWKMVLDGHVYRDRICWLVTYAPHGQQIAGYLVAANGLADATDDVHVYEVVGDDEQISTGLIKYAQRLATSRRVVFPFTSIENPICPLLRKLDFLERQTTPHIMARMLRCDRVFRSLAQESDLLNTLELKICTPHRTLTANQPQESRYKVLLETKESSLARLFCRRLDLQAAVEMGIIRWNCHDSGISRELRRLFGYERWIQWFTDYV